MGSRLVKLFGLPRRSSAPLAFTAALSPAAILVLAEIERVRAAPFPAGAGVWLGVAVAVLAVLGSILHARRPTLGRSLGVAAAAIFGCAGAVGLLHDPLVALVALLVALGVGVGVVALPSASWSRRAARQSARAAAFGALVAVVASAGFQLIHDRVGQLALLGAALVVLAHGVARLDRRAPKGLLVGIAAASLGVALSLFEPAVSALAASVVPWTLLLLLPKDARRLEGAGLWSALTADPIRLLVLSFGLAGLVGAVLLTLPVASAGPRIDVIDALFTSFSAVCVTGLIVLDTAVDLSSAGQAIVLLLIQVGGLGIMTLSAAAFVVLGRRMSLRSEAAAVEFVGSGGRGALPQVLKRVLLVTVISEAATATALVALFLVRGDSLATASWRAVFTAVSAFCNAGFALQSDSLVAYAGDPLILAVISIAIVTGGLGPVVVVAAPAWLRGERVSLHARLVLGCTLGLLVAPAALIFALERTHALADRSIVDGLMNAWFQSVTTRTAGFNSVELGALRPATSYLMCLLMFVGGSPGSTAGGIKTTTLCVLALATVSVARGSASVRVGGRRLPGAILLDALAVTVATATAIAGGLLLLLLTQDINPSLLAFEVVSAVATVGLSLGITAELDEVGRVIVTLLMLIGRVGPLAVVCALLPHQPVPRWELPEERIPIG